MIIKVLKSMGGYHYVCYTMRKYDNTIYYIFAISNFPNLHLNTPPHYLNWFLLHWHCLKKKQYTLFANVRLSYLTVVSHLPILFIFDVENGAHMHRIHRKIYVCVQFFIFVFAIFTALLIFSRAEILQVLEHLQFV